jgi:hypothetical protein
LAWRWFTRTETYCQLCIEDFIYMLCFTEWITLSYCITQRDGCYQNFGWNISLLNKCYKLYSRVLNEKLKTQAEGFPLEWKNGFRKKHIFALIRRLIWIIYKKRKEFDLETNFAFYDYVKDSDKLKKEKLFEILQNRNIRNLLLNVQ